jgi:hypothetical protein
VSWDWGEVLLVLVDCASGYRTPHFEPPDGRSVIPAVVEEQT